MSLNIYSNLLDFIYVYPPTLIIIYSLVIINNKCDFQIPEFIKKIFTDSNDIKNTSHPELKSARKQKLKDTNNIVIIIFGTIGLICYLFIRFFMDKIKNRIDLQQVNCKLKEDVMNDLKKKMNKSPDSESKIEINKTIKKMEDICRKRGNNQSNKKGKCKSCITFEQKDEYFQGYPCELQDSNDPNIKISGELNQKDINIDEKCKYYISDDEEIKLEKDKNNRALYIFNNLVIFLLIMFSLGYLLHKYNKVCSILIPIILMLILIIIILSVGENFNFSNDLNVYIFNAILLLIISIIHSLNIWIYHFYIYK